MTDASSHPADPLVSVLIPCFNNEPHVAEAVESVLVQTHPRVEVIVVDDGSTDRSADVLRSFGDRITWEAGPNRGACAARNRAFELSSGEFVQYLDADDRLRPEKVARQLPPLLADEADLVTCRGAIFGDGKGLRPKKEPPPDPAGRQPLDLALNCGLSTEGPLIRRSLVERVGGFRDGLPRGQEREFHWRLAAAGMRIVYLDTVLYDHRHDPRPGRITQTRQPPGYNAEILCDFAELAESGPPFELTASDRVALARRLLDNADYAHRGGVRPVAARAFALASRISPTVRPEDLAGWKCVLWRSIGPLWTADLLAAGRLMSGRDSSGRPRWRTRRIRSGGVAT